MKIASTNEARLERVAQTESEIVEIHSVRYHLGGQPEFSKDPGQVVGRNNQPVDTAKNRQGRPPSRQMITCFTAVVVKDRFLAAQPANPRCWRWRQQKRRIRSGENVQEVRVLGLTEKAQKI